MLTAPGSPGARRGNPKRLALAAILCVSGTLGAGPAAANPAVPPVPTLECGDRVVAGQLVTVRWNAVGFDVEELELLLSVDGGRSFPLRVSPELEAGEGRYAWKVPNLGANEARIRIRARIAGREVEGPAGPAFRILAALGRPSRCWLFHENGWWGEATPDSQEPGSMGPARGPTLQSHTVSLPVEPPVRTFDTSPVPRFRQRSPGAPASPLAGVTTSNPSLPRSFPLLT